MSGKVIPFNKTKGRGVVHIYPSWEDDGCWAVDHWSDYGDSNARLGTFMCSDDAVLAARQWAAELGAVYHGDKGDAA